MEVQKNNDDKNTITLQEKNKMKKKIEQLNTNHCSELFEIIKKNTEKYTINKNGVFLNLKNLNQKTLHEINHFLSYIDSVNKTLNEDRF